MSKKINWTRSTEIQLIQEVRERPILWDISHPQYNRSDLKTTAWEKVAEGLGSQMTYNLAKERFENLRTTFMRNKKKIKDSTSSGKGTDDIYRPKWDLYPLLTFLRKSTAQSTSVSNLDDDANNAAMSIAKESNSGNIASSIYFDENLQKWIMIPKDTQGEMISSEIPSSMSSFSEVSEQNLLSSPHSASVFLPEPLSDPCRPASAPVITSDVLTNRKRSIQSDDMYVKRGKKSSSDSSIMEEAVAAIKHLSKEENSQADAYDHFGAYVAAQLRIMTREQRAYCEVEIVKILSNKTTTFEI